VRSTRRLLAASSLALALLLLAPISAAEVAAPGSGSATSDAPVAAIASQGPAWPARAVSGRSAIEALGERLPVVARRQGWTEERLEATLLNDSTLHVDPTGRLFYAEKPPPDAAETSATSADPVAASAAPYPLSDTFNLHSQPGANLTILLDFGPRTMSGNAWTASRNGGSDIPCPVWSLDADPAFGDAEKTAIQEIWQRVAEDYAPFDVDVTTGFTTEAAITRANAADRVYGTRVLISPISSYFGAYGGIAYVWVFDDVGDYYKPALVFPERLGNNAKRIAEAAAHEAGHNLALDHDGATGVEYYRGSGSGPTGWAPIMGSGYDRALTQWSKGEYPDANNQEDDLGIIRGFLGYKADDAGDSAGAAFVLPESTSMSAAGIIASATDVDVYRFSAGEGAATIDVSPAPVGPNLDVSVEIRDSAGALVASDNPADQLAAHLAPTLSAGTYYVHVRGTGKGSPLDVGGYSEYGSVGRYTLECAVPRPSGPAPRGALAGTVTVSGGGVLEGVSVSVPGTATVTSEPDGRYAVSSVTTGNHTVTYSKTGYTNQQVEVTISSDTTTTRDVALVPIAPQATTPIHRFYNKVNGSHFYTASEAEKQSVVANLSATYALDGVAYTVSSGFGTPLHRFYNKANGSHFYTASPAEKDSVIANLSATYSYDGIAYRVSPTSVAGSVAVYRFYNRVNGSHFYTASIAERDAVLENLSAVYALDGVAFHVMP